MQLIFVLGSYTLPDPIKPDTATGMNTDEALKLVTNQAKAYDELASSLSKQGRDDEASAHLRMSRQFAELNNHIEQLAQRLNSATSHLNILPSELEGLPDELRAQLSTDDFELNILRLMEDFGGTISLDRLILEWYKRHKEILQRRNVTAKLYRMMKSQTIFSLKSKGVYTIHEPKNENDNQGSIAEPDKLGELNDMLE